MAQNEQHFLRFFTRIALKQMIDAMLGCLQSFRQLIYRKSASLQAFCQMIYQMSVWLQAFRQLIYPKSGSLQTIRQLIYPSLGSLQAFRQMIYPKLGSLQAIPQIKLAFSSIQIFFFHKAPYATKQLQMVHQIFSSFINKWSVRTPTTIAYRLVSSPTEAGKAFIQPLQSPMQSHKYYTL